MTKKEYILTILSRLELHRGLAKPLHDLVANTDVDSQFVDGICALLMEAIHDVSDSIAKDKLIQSQEIIKKLQAHSDTTLEDLDKELDVLLADL